MLTKAICYLDNVLILKFIALLSVGTIPDSNEAFIHRTMIRPMLKGAYDDMRM